MRKKIILFCSGETDLSASDIIEGQSKDLDLNENGIKRTMALANEISKFNIKIIYSGPSQRAFATANIIAHPPHLFPYSRTIVARVKSLAEINFGTVEGLCINSLKDDELKLWQQWNSAECHEKICFSEGESKVSAINRISKTLKNIIVSEHHGYIGICLDPYIFRCFLISIGCPLNQVNSEKIYLVNYNGSSFYL